MNSAQLRGVSQYTSTTKAASPATKTPDTNQFPPTVMTTATSAIGYANGILYLEHDVATVNNNNNNNVNSNAAQVELRYNIVDNDVNVEDEDDNNKNNLDNDDEETDSFASMETLSDNVSIWIDGEKHWISGVDANTTCSDLISALLNYQDGQQMFHASRTSNKNEGNARSNSFGNDTNNTNNNKTGNNAINQSTTNTKEDCKNGISSDGGDGGGGGLTTLFDDYVIVRQHRHCEEYLDGSTKVFDILPSRDMPTARKECELMLRRLTAATSTTAPPLQRSTQVSSLLSTDKDSGMGSPVGSCSRSAKFRRRKHKSSNWLAQGNTLHPKLSSSQRTNNGGGPNERLLKIILAQDETIHRQLSLLRDKERQISRIEEEKHRVRERELGKNYLLETYLNGLDEADDEPDLEEGGVEIFIDEPYQRFPTATPAAAATKTASPTTKHRSAPKSLLQKHQQQQQQQRKKRKDAGTAAAIAQKDSLDATDETTTIAAGAAATKLLPADGGNQKEIELQILWMERVYAINKQLQREEELLVKLHAKVRKHHVKRAYQTQKEVIQQIDKLDTELTRQCADIRTVEDNLLTSNEQLEKKLCILEQLSQEFLQEATTTTTAVDGESTKSEAAALTTPVVEVITSVTGAAASTEEANSKNDNYACKQKTLATCNRHHENQPPPQPEHQLQRKPPTTSVITMPTKAEIATPSGQQQLPRLVSDNDDDDDVQRGEVLCATTAQTKHKLQLQQMLHTPEDLLKLQRLIAKPTATTTTSPLSMVTTLPQSLASSAMLTATLASSSPSAAPALFAATMAESHQHHPHRNSMQQNNYPISCINHCGISSENCATTTATTSNSVTIANIIDKNMLPLHVSNAKTVKKQMFGPAKLLHQMAAPSPPTTTFSSQPKLPLPHPSSSNSNKSYQPSGLNPPLDILADITRLGTLV